MAKIASYAGMRFEVTRKKILSFSDLSISRGVDYEEHRRIHDKPLMEFVARQNAVMTVTVIAKSSLGVTPRKIWDKFAKIRDERKAAYFYFGAGKNNGKKGSAGQRMVGRDRWVITDISNAFKSFYVNGMPTEITFDITLKEYPHRAAKSSKPSNKTKAASEKKKTPTSAKKKNYTLYTTQKGDTLWALAKKYYGKGSKYTKIYNANRDGKDGTHKLTDPNNLQAGWKIKIPR